MDTQLPINHRVKETRLSLGINQAEIADLTKIKRSTISKIENGKMEVPNDLIMFLRRTYNISTEWLFTGEGDMHTGKTAVKEYTNHTDSRVEEQEVPLYEHEAAAGLTKLFSNSENVLDFIRIPNLPKCDGAVHISGDSMYPLLKSGDIVMYKQVNDIANGIFYGEMYLLSVRIDDEDYTLVKYIHRSDLGHEYIRLVSQNQYHAPKDVLLQNIRALALIKASIRINSMA